MEEFEDKEKDWFYNSVLSIKKKKVRKKYINFHKVWFQKLRCVVMLFQNWEFLRFFFFPPGSKFSKFILKIAGNTETERKQFMEQLYLYFVLCHLDVKCLIIIITIILKKQRKRKIVIENYSCNFFKKTPNIKTCSTSNTAKKISAFKFLHGAYFFHCFNQLFYLSNGESFSGNSL